MAMLIRPEPGGTPRVPRTYLGLYPIVTSQYSATALYQISEEIQ